MTWQVEQSPWYQAKSELQALRQAVFIIGQNISPEDEYDGLDETATHFLVRQQGKAIACARTLEKDGTIKIGRLAVLKTYRKQGLGRFLLQTVCDHYPNQTQVLDAQCYLIHFYQSMGFTLCGRVFMDAGIAHLPMIKLPTPY